jgi:2-polyprenyl-3-methyl-5-hydroxy-6-metoxy-1,4-benzoquinol methylase
MLPESKKEHNLLQHYTAHKKYYSSINKKILKKITKISHVDFMKHQILDLGCGDGRLCSILSNFDISSYVGVDFCPIRTNVAIQRNFNINFKIITTSIQDFLNINKEKFDTTFLFETLEHLEDTESIITETKKISKHIIGSVPINMPYVAHLQIYKNTAEVKEKLGCKILFIDKKHYFFYIKGKL